MQRSYEETCEVMLKQLLFEREQQDREKVEIEELRVKTENARNRYYAAKMENDRLQIQIDRRVAIHSQLRNNNDEEQKKLQRGVGDVIKRVNDLVKEFDSVKREDLADITRTRKAMECIPIDFSDDAMAERSTKIDREYVDLKKKLVEGINKFGDMKEKYKTESEQLEERDSAMEAFIKEQKMINAMLKCFGYPKTAEVRRSQSR